MGRWAWLSVAVISFASAACGGKVVFVEADDDGEPTNGGSPPAGDFCASLCASGIGCPPLNDDSCAGWCNERLAIAGECAKEFQLIGECLMENPPSDCSVKDVCGPQVQAYQVCTLGCTTEPLCEDGPNQTVCSLTCLNDFEWTCTQGLPEACVCAVDGKVVETCTLAHSPVFAACCDGAFAATH